MRGMDKHMSYMKPTEEKCRDCSWFTFWSGHYGGSGEYPACSHPKSGPRATNLLDEIDECPKE